MNYKEVIDHSPIPFILTNKGGMVVEANPAACALLNYSTEEIKGVLSEEIITEKIIANKNVPVGDARKQLKEGFGIKKCGEKFPVEYKTHLFESENREVSTALIILNHQSSSNYNDSKEATRTSSGNENEFEFSRLFTENPSSGWILDQKSLKILDANKTALQLFGYSKEEFLKKTVFDLLPGKEADRLKAALRKETGFSKAYTGHWKNKLKNGNIIYVKIPKNIMDDSERIILLAIDVTSYMEDLELKEYERASKEPLINSTLDQIWSVSSDYKLIAANKSLIRLLETATGITFKQGDNLMEHPFTKDFTKIWDTYFQRALLGERVKEIAYIPEHSKLPARWVELFINAVFEDKKIIGAVFYTRNITERIIAEQKIRESEANLAEAQRLANLGNWSKDLRTGELKWSDQLFEIFGIKKQHFTNSNRSFFNLVHSCKKHTLLEAMKRTRKTGEPYSLIYHITTPKGEEKIIEEKGYGKKNELGEVVRTFGTAQDITKKMLTEEALRSSVESYNLVSKATNDSIWDWNMETGRVTRSGDGFRLLFGYGNDFGTEKDYIYDELIHPDDVKEVKKSQKFVFQNPKENYWEAEFRFLKANGNYAHVYDRGYIVRDETGKPKRMIGATLDFTLQKEHLKEIKRMQRNLQAVIDTTEDLVWSLDVDLKIITANKAFTKIGNHLFAKPISEGDKIITPDLDKSLAEKWVALYNRALKGEKFSVDHEETYNGGGLLSFFINSFSPIINKEGLITGVACHSKNITEIKKYEEELKLSHERFKDLFSLNPQPMWLYEKDSYKICEINKAAINHYGYTEKEFLNMTIMDIRPVIDVQKTKKIINGRRLGKVPDFNQVFRHVKKNGEIIEVHIYSTPLQINDKDYTLVVAIDVTEERRHEHNINKVIIKAQENERFEIGGELHDNICQLLASSKMRISILKEHIPEDRMKIYEESKDFIVIALEEIRNLSHRLAPSFFNDKTLEEAFTKLFNSFNFLKEYSIKTTFCENVLQQNLALDLKLNLYRILQEQLKNIIKYAKATEITLEVCMIENLLTMSIADNGIGFDAQEVKGGIGLSNMKRRAELSSGELQLKTSPGNGTEILVTIPV